VRAALLVAVVFALGACGGNGDDNAAAIPAGLVDPGTYMSEPFEPAMHLTIDEQGWRALFARPSARWHASYLRIEERELGPSQSTAVS
jgi:hypothetical protein